MKLTIERNEINDLLRAALHDKLELEVIEFGDDKAVLKIRKGIKVQLTLRGFRLEDGRISASLESNFLLSKLINLIEPLLEEYNLEIEKDRLAIQLPSDLQSIIDLQKVAVKADGITLSGMLKQA